MNTLSRDCDIHLVGIVTYIDEGTNRGGKNNWNVNQEAKTHRMKVLQAKH